MRWVDALTQPNNVENKNPENGVKGLPMREPVNPSLACEMRI